MSIETTETARSYCSGPQPPISSAFYIYVMAFFSLISTCIAASSPKAVTAVLKDTTSMEDYPLAILSRFWFISDKLTPSRCTIHTPKSQVKLGSFFHFNTSSLLFLLLTEIVCQINFTRNQGVPSVMDLRSRCSRQFSDLGTRSTALRLKKEEPLSL